MKCGRLLEEAHGEERFRVEETTILDRRTQETIAIFTEVNDHLGSPLARRKVFCPRQFNEYNFKVLLTGYVIGTLDPEKMEDVGTRIRKFNEGGRK